MDQVIYSLQCLYTRVFINRLAVFYRVLGGRKTGNIWCILFNKRAI